MKQEDTQQVRTRVEDGQGTSKAESLLKSAGEPSPPLQRRVTDSTPVVALRELWRSIQSNRWTRWTADLLLIGLVLLVVSSFQTRSLLKSGESAPDFQLRDLNGELVSLEEFRGKPVLLAFWAPWCGACKLESSNISRVQRWVGKRASVISIAVEYPDRPSVERYVSEQKVDYPVLLGSRSQSEDYKLKGFPTVYFINSKGEVKRAAMGYTTTLGLWLRLMLF